MDSELLAFCMTGLDDWIRPFEWRTNEIIANSWFTALDRNHRHQSNESRRRGEACENRKSKTKFKWPNTSGWYSEKMSSKLAFTRKRAREQRQRWMMWLADFVILSYVPKCRNPNEVVQSIWCQTMCYCSSSFSLLYRDFVHFTLSFPISFLSPGFHTIHIVRHRRDKTNEHLHNGNWRLYTLATCVRGVNETRHKTDRKWGEAWRDVDEKCFIISRNQPFNGPKCLRFKMGKIPLCFDVYFFVFILFRSLLFKIRLFGTQNTVEMIRDWIWENLHADNESWYNYTQSLAGQSRKTFWFHFRSRAPRKPKRESVLLVHIPYGRMVCDIARGIVHRTRCLARDTNKTKCNI